MIEKELVDIIAITADIDSEGRVMEGPHWRQGYMTAQTYAEVLHCPPGTPMVDIPLQLNGVGEGVTFGLFDILPNLSAHQWDNFRSLS